MRHALVALFFTLGSCFIPSAPANETAAEDKPKTEKKSKEKVPAALDFKMKTLDGKKIHLADKYKDKVVMFVNVASRCGYTPQYEGLQKLHEKYGKKGLAIVGVPCNQFGSQEPGTSEQIAKFCETKYGVEFDMLAKVNVRADKEKQCKLYEHLTGEKTNPKHGGNVKWNFEKFLLNHKGEVIGHYRSKVAPDSKELVTAIEKALKDAPAPKTAKKGTKKESEKEAKKAS